MSGLLPYFKTRDLSVDFINPGVEMLVNSLEWEAMGGPSRASISLAGNEAALWQALEWMRYGVTIRDGYGRDVWWGYLADPTVRVGAMEVGLTMASLANHITVAYSYVTPGTNLVGRRKTTTPITDADSIAEFGQKEWVSSGGGMSDETANNRAAAILASRRYPQGGTNALSGLAPRSRLRYSGAQHSCSGTLMLQGWWSTMGWRYANVPTVSAVSYTGTSATEQAVGAAAANTRVMQQITVRDFEVRALTIEIYGRKQGSPADNLVIGLYALDSSGNPSGSALANLTLAGSGLSASLGWISGTLSAEVELDYKTQYGLQVSRSGADDASNYYVINANEAAGYSGGVLKLYNSGTSAWAARSPAADMPFSIKVNNWVETSQQMHNLAMEYGQFFAGVSVETASGVYQPSFQNGSQTARQVFEDLAEFGGPNDRRILAEVLSNRYVRIYEEPAAGNNYKLDINGVVYTPGGGVVDGWIPPVGQWIELIDVVPDSVDTSRMINPNVQFVEGARWSAQGGLQLRYKGQPSIEDVLKLKEDL